MLQSKKRSKLHRHKNDIIRLRKKGVTLSCIQEWLKNKYLLTTSCENIRQFYLRYQDDLSDEEVENYNPYKDI